MRNESNNTRITVRTVIAATADVTGTGPLVLCGPRRFEPVVTHRRCAHAAAIQLGIGPTRVERGMGLRRGSINPRALKEFAAAHAETVAQIARRATELAAGNAGPIVAPGRAQPVSMDLVLVATTVVAGCGMRDLRHHGRLQPWETYYKAAQAAARRLGLGPTQIGRALGRANHTISGRAGRMAAIEQAHGPLISEIVAQVHRLAALPEDRLHAIMSPAALAVPPTDPREVAKLRRITAAATRPPRPVQHLEAMP